MAELKKILSYPANDIDKILQQGIYSVADNTERDALATTIKTINRTIYVRSTKKMFVWENNAWRDITPGGEVLVGTSAPTTVTVGYLGQFYLDTTNNSTYQCVAVDTSIPSYAWVELLRDSNLKTVNGNSVVGSGDITINTYQNFPVSWTTNSTTADLMADIANDASAMPGMAYLGEVTCSDLPFNGNAELIVSIIKGAGSNKVIVAQLTSGNVRPYYWQYTYWDGSGTGWKSFISSESVDNVPTQGSTNVVTSGGVYEALQGKVEPLSFDNYSQAITAINAASSTAYNIGQDVLFIQTGIPDLWFSGRESVSVPYTYTTDEALIEDLLANGYIRVGYYKLSYLEDELQTVMTIHREEQPAPPTPVQLTASVTPQAGVTYTPVTDLTSYTDTQINEISKAISNCADITNTTETIYLSDETSISIGATRSYTLSTQEAMTDRILGFNHDDLTDSGAYGEATATGKAGITWQMVNCLATRYLMNDSNTNAGGWNGSKMRTLTLPTIKALLPSDLQTVIKFVDKKAANGGSSNYSATVTTSENLFLLAGVEIFGSSLNYGHAQDGANEGTQYAYWTSHNTANDRIKYYDNAGTQTATSWWERSSYSSDIYYFCVGSFDGGASLSDANSSRGVAFAYCT